MAGRVDGRVCCRCGGVHGGHRRGFTGYVLAERPRRHIWAAGRPLVPSSGKVPGAPRAPLGPTRRPRARLPAALPPSDPASLGARGAWRAAPPRRPARAQIACLPGARACARGVVARKQQVQGRAGPGDRVCAPIVAAWQRPLEERCDAGLLCAVHAAHRRCPPLRLHPRALHAPPPLHAPRTAVAARGGSYAWLHAPAARPHECASAFVLESRSCPASRDSPGHGRRAQARLACATQACAAAHACARPGSCARSPNRRAIASAGLKAWQLPAATAARRPRRGATGGRYWPHRTDRPESPTPTHTCTGAPVAHLPRSSRPPAPDAPQ